ncbi:MAG: filamentous hemagglutinin N-terminal domain-containing protein [Rickettsiales bacterium]|nr:filamentous hemagglutinin N-terminal domain-containing protein [Rickettsiales bacterium]
MQHSTSRTLTMNQRLWSHSSALSAAMFVIPSLAFALPTGGTNVEGVANITQGVNTTTINQSTDRAVINWDTFNVNTNETVRFNQNDASSITLNRVTADANPSQILGSIQANGQVVITNPNGIVFGENSRTDVAGLIATTADIDNKNFMQSDALRFSTPGATNAKIDVKQGAFISASAAQEGLVALVAPQVVNQGVIVARTGTVILAGAETATVDLNGDGLVSFTVDNAKSDAAKVQHGGQISAQGGRVFITAKAAGKVVDSVINTNGLVDAQQLVDNGNGLVLLEGGIDVSGNVKKVRIDNPEGIDARRSIEAVLAENEAPVKGGKIEVRGNDIVSRKEAELNASGNQGGFIFVSANRHAVLGNGTSLNSSAYSDAKTRAGGVTVLAKNGNAELHSDASISANGYHGGKVSFSGANILLSGELSAASRGGDHGIIAIDPATITINDGAANGLANNIAEQWIEAQSQSGADVTIEATDLIHLENLTDSVLLGGAGDITLRTLGAAGAVRFDSTGDYIRTTTGDVNIFAGTGGIQIGNIATGIDGAYPAFDAPAGDVHAGTIRLTTTGGGNVTARNLVARGTRDTSSILIDSTGSFTGRSLSVRVDDTPAPGGADTAKIDVKAVGDILINESVIARGKDEQGTTREARAVISLVSTTGDVTTQGQVFANADGGIRLPADPGLSLANITISGRNVNARRIEANANGGQSADATVNVTAANRLTANNDIVSIAKKTAGGIGDAIGNLTITALETFVPLTDVSTVFRATHDLTVSGPVTVSTPEDATLLGGSPLPLESARIFRLQGDNSVNATGAVTSLLANIEAIGGAGGLSVANLTTGDLARVNGYVLNQATGSFKAGNITLSTANGGDITTGNLSAAGTLGATTISANSARNLTTGNITMLGNDLPDSGGQDLVALSLNALEDILVGGDIDLQGIDRQGGTHSARTTLDATAGGDITVAGNVSVLAQGGFRGKQIADVGTSFASASFNAGQNLTVANVDVDALGGTQADSALLLSSPAGTVTLGNTRARANTSTVSETGVPLSGVANASVEIRALGTAANSDANIVYNGANTFSEANSALLQSRFTSVQTVSGNTARITIINPTLPGGGGGGGGITVPVVPVAPPIDGGAPVPDGGVSGGGITPPVVAPLAANPLTLVEIELTRTSDFASNLYSFYGETVGDQYYFGNTDVNLSLLGGGTVNQVSFSNDPSALAGLSPAAGGSSAQDVRRRPRLTGGSEAKRARYAWANATSEGAGARTTVQANASSSAESLATLSPAAGGNVAQNLNQLAPAAGDSGSCGNNYLDEGYAAGFDDVSCREGSAF